MQECPQCGEVHTPPDGPEMPRLPDYRCPHCEQAMRSVFQRVELGRGLYLCPLCSTTVKVVIPDNLAVVTAYQAVPRNTPLDTLRLV